MYQALTEPWAKDDDVANAEKAFKDLSIPFYTGSGAYAYTYKLHWLGAQHWFQNVKTQPRKLLFAPPAHLERPFAVYHDEIIRWYDHWLKGKDTGILDEPPVKYWVMGANEWRTGQDWPLPETQWTKYFLSTWERLTTQEPDPSHRLRRGDHHGGLHGGGARSRRDAARQSVDADDRPERPSRAAGPDR
jgi:predicted acyl esterase